MSRVLQVTDVTWVQQVEDTVGEDDLAAARPDVGGQRRRFVDRHRPDILMPPENDHLCGGRKMPTSLSGDFTRNVYSKRW